MATFTWIPDQGATENTEAMVDVAKYGDGYSQRVAYGINNLSMTWDLSFSNRTRAEINAIRDFLEAHRTGTSFSWAPSDEAQAKYIATKWKRTLRTDLDSAISVTFEKVYGQ